MEDFQTPMMQQYLSLKAQYPDCLLLFRLGDFYELFMEDAKIGAAILGITLTSRDRGKDGRIPMAGVPYHALDSYLHKLVKAGHKVAVCAQMTEPKAGTLVQREVTRIVTPGTLFEENVLVHKDNNFVFTLYKSDKKFSVAMSDISTGNFMVGSFSNNELDDFLLNQLLHYKPTECVLAADLYNDNDLKEKLKNIKGLNIYKFDAAQLDVSKSKALLGKYFDTHNLVFDTDVSIIAAGILLSYLLYTQCGDVKHIKSITQLHAIGFMHLDRFTTANLELFETIRDANRSGSLLSVIDKTVTSMGGRLLKLWLARPLLDTTQIIARSTAIEELINLDAARARLTSSLSHIQDIERIISRLAVGIGNAKDLVALKLSLENSLQTYTGLTSFSSELLKELTNTNISEITNLISLINTTIVEDPPVDTKSGGMIRYGFDSHLDSLRSTALSSKEFVANLEATERDKTGISTLKVRYNKVFGYYIEVTKANVSQVPNTYERKQTLVNAERYVTSDLKNHEDIILNAEEEIKNLEYKIFIDLVNNILSQVTLIQRVASDIAHVDCLVSLSLVALENRWVKPAFTHENKIEIIGGRHPLVEALLPKGSVVSNDTVFDTDESLYIITGPNMSGKSVYIRQVALIAILAQMGSFVPAKSALLSTRDRVFVRSGAADAIGLGHSTFMVEMVETAYILNNATSASLIIMDEIGRGTSTYDGISIAWAIAEYLVKDTKFSPKTLFATHYHELQDLENIYPNKIKNYQVLVKKHNSKPVFLHKVVPGGAEHSFGIDVAQLAGVPETVILSATELLKKLEGAHAKNKDTA